MSVLEQMQAEVTLVMDELTDICKRYKFDAIPTVLLRHREGSSKSILMSNDKPSAMVMTIAELNDIGRESNMTGQEAIMKLFTGD